MSEDILRSISPQAILDSINDGVYVTDRNRIIVYWSKSAERITGWLKEEVIGRACLDSVLCHVDKDNRILCGKESCPLYRAMRTGQGSTIPITVFGQNRDGIYKPMQVSVSPVIDEEGQIIGGVEVFRDLSENIRDLKRAKAIQLKSLKWNLTVDSPIRFSVHYIPHDIIGGDYYAVKALSPTKHVFMLADVIGHGVSAALYTMYLSSLWEEYSELSEDPVQFIEKLNNQFHQLVHEETAFATAVCGLVDTDSQTISIVLAAHPSPFIFRSNGSVEEIRQSGLPLGFLENISYKSETIGFNPGDILFMFTDGAVEIQNEKNELMGRAGLLELLQRLGYPNSAVTHQEIESQLLSRSANVMLDDDITFLQIHWMNDRSSV